LTAAAVVLAAGAGRRFVASGAAGPKPLAELAGVALVDRVLAAAVEAGLDEVILVDGATDLSDRASTTVTVLHNPGWAEGIASSLAVAIDHARRQGHEAVVVGLADQPGVLTGAWRAVAGAPPDPPIAVATYSGRRGNPVRLDQAAWDRLPVTGDEGARILMREHPELVAEVACEGDPFDVDTADDLARWE
jgi:nicotine blue oxidoreductase